MNDKMNEWMNVNGNGKGRGNGRVARKCQDCKNGNKTMTDGCGI